jgi:hypothetical protein
VDRRVRRVHGSPDQRGHAVRKVHLLGSGLAVLGILQYLAFPVSAATCKNCTPPPKKTPITAGSPAWIEPPAWMNLPANAQFLGVVTGADGSKRLCWKYVRRTLCDAPGTRVP